MSNYTPEEWMLIRVKGSTPHYRVFGSWRGGFLDGDSWRLNSGIVSVEEDEDYYIFNGNTGSKYVCFKNNYGINSPWNRQVLDDICNNDMGEVLEDKPDVMRLQWNES